MAKGVIFFFVFIGVIIILFGYIGYSIYQRDNAPDNVYCKDTVPIIYINQTTLTDNIRCLDYLIGLDYKLLTKNGSYYILLKEDLK